MKLFFAASLAVAAISPGLHTTQQTPLAASASVTAIRISPFPVAPAGDLLAGESTGLTVKAFSGTTPAPGATVYLTAGSPGTSTVPAGQCRGVANLSLTPTECTTDASGQVIITYTAPTPAATACHVRFIAQNAFSNPSARAADWYICSILDYFSSSPIARSNTLGPSSSVPVTLLLRSAGGRALANAVVQLALTSTASSSGTATVGGTRLTSSPKQFVADSNGALSLTYTTPAHLPASGVDTITVRNDRATDPPDGSDSYAFTAGYPVVSVGDASTVEGDQNPTIPAGFTLTLSSPQPTPVTVDYYTSCGIGDLGCGEDITQILTPQTATIRAGATSFKVKVRVFSYTGARGGRMGETFPETYYVHLSNPAGAVLGRSIGSGLIMPDPEGTVPTAQLFASDVGVVSGDTGSPTTAYFVVTLLAPQSTAVTMLYATADGSAAAGTDYTSTTGSATIPAGKTSATIPVQVTGETGPDVDETFSLTLTNAAGATIARATGTGTIFAEGQ